MAVPTVTPLPTPPNRTSGAGEFAAKADVFYGAMPQFQTDMNTLATYSGQQVSLADTARIAAEQAKAAAESARSTVVTRANEVATNTNTVVTRANEVAANTLQVAADADQVAADRVAVDAALASIADGPVASVAGKSGVVTVEDLSAGGVATQNGAETLNNKTINSTRYTVASIATTETLDLAVSQVFRVDASAPRTLMFANEPGTDRAMTLVIHLSGSSGVIWPSSITWDSGVAPVMGTVFTRVVLFWDGVQWTGTKEVTR